MSTNSGRLAGKVAIITGAKLFCTQSNAKSVLVMCKTIDRQARKGYGSIMVG